MLALIQKSPAQWEIRLDQKIIIFDQDGLRDVESKNILRKRLKKLSDFIYFSHFCLTEIFDILVRLHQIDIRIFGPDGSLI